jgi:hypothetical protein
VSGSNAAGGSNGAGGSNAASGANAAAGSNAADGSNAASGTNGADGSTAGGSASNATPSGSNVVDNATGGSMPGASTSPLVSADERITVAIVQNTANSSLSGMISVSVPRSVINTAVEFRFRLPTQVLAGLNSTNQVVKVTLMNGKPLPKWLTFQPSSGLFVANGMPMHGLPLEVVVRTGAGNWAVMIAEKND